MSNETDLAAETITAQGLHHVDPNTGAVAPSIQPSSTFGRDEDYQLIVPSQGYTRDENPGYLIPGYKTNKGPFPSHPPPSKRR